MLLTPFPVFALGLLLFSLAAACYTPGSPRVTWLLVPRGHRSSGIALSRVQRVREWRLVSFPELAGGTGLVLSPQQSASFGVTGSPISSAPFPGRWLCLMPIFCSVQQGTEPLSSPGAVLKQRELFVRGGEQTPSRMLRTKCSFIQHVVGFWIQGVIGSAPGTGF